VVLRLTNKEINSKLGYPESASTVELLFMLNCHSFSLLEQWLILPPNLS